METQNVKPITGEDQPISDKIEVTKLDLNALFHQNSSISKNIEGFQEIGVTGDLIKALKNYGFLTGSWFNEYGSGSNTPWLDLLSLYNIWKDGQNFISNNWDYENLPNDMDKWEFERILLENGKLAVVRNFFGLFVVNYVVTKQDFFTNHPTQIRITNRNSVLNDSLIEEEDFVIFKNDPDERAVLTHGLRYLLGMIMVLNELEENVISGKTKFIINKQGRTLSGIDDNQTQETWNMIFKSKQRVWVTDEAISTTSKNSYSTGKLSDLIGTENTDMVIPMQPEDRISQLQEAFLFFRDLFKETLGASPNMMSRKKERNISAEIDDNKDISQSNIETMFKLRENRVKQMNSKFGTNTIIKRVEPSNQGENDNDKQSEFSDKTE